VSKFEKSFVKYKMIEVKFGLRLCIKNSFIVLRTKAPVKGSIVAVLSILIPGHEMSGIKFVFRTCFNK
jgi:hypothetical protein